MEHGRRGRPGRGPWPCGRRNRPPRYGAGHLDHGHAQHDPAAAQDVARVPLYHAVVDYLGVERGQVQVGQGLDELQQYDDDDGVAVGAQSKTAGAGGSIGPGLPRPAQARRWPDAGWPDTGWPDAGWPDAGWSRWLPLEAPLCPAAGEAPSGRRAGRLRPYGLVHSGRSQNCIAARAAAS